MAKVYRVSLPDSHPLDRRTLKGIPALVRGAEPIELELESKQVEDLKRKGVRVVAKASKVEDEPKTAAMPRKGKESE